MPQGRGGTSLIKVGSYGYYWSSPLYTDCPYFAWYVSFDSVHVDRDRTDRYSGLSIRPVYEE